MTTYQTCECADPFCPACEGRCTETATVTLVRIDFVGMPTCDFCPGCAKDALDSEIFETLASHERADYDV